MKVLLNMTTPCLSNTYYSLNKIYSCIILYNYSIRIK